MATIPQLYEVLGILSGRLAKEGTPWMKVDTTRLQERVIKNPDRFAEDFVAFIANDAQLVVGELKSFAINRSAPFNPAKLLGSGWTIWKGPKDGNGLEGEEEQDARSLSITEVKLSEFSFEHCLKSEESSITGETKVGRLEKDHSHLIRPDAQFVQALLDESGRRTLEYIRVNLKKTWFDITGTVLRSPRGARCILYLSLFVDQWHWHSHPLDGGWYASDPSLVLASDQP